MEKLFDNQIFTIDNIPTSFPMMDVINIKIQ